MSANGGKTRILLADDHLVVRMGIASIISFEPDLEVVAEADTGEEAVALARTHKPDVVVMDLMMPKLNGANATVAILQENPAIRVLILTTFGTSEDMRRALDAGAAGGLVKSSSQAEIIAAIRAVAAGRRVLSPEIEHSLGTAADPPPLSIRQLEVLNLAAKGFTNREIGDILGIGVNGVKAHLKLIYTRLGVASRTEATSIAINLRLISV
ncbi:MAG: response regulator transcription factor [Kiritimatiellae bacterium]|nr:response regulator transcription factor [Kiritimatiellia bacterium]